MISFDAIIIGAGQAGPPLAGRLTAAGMKVALIERKLFGGTCVNTGCMPTKTLVASAYAIHTARRGNDYGFSLSGDLHVDMPRIRDRAQTITRDARSGVEAWLRGMNGCTVFKGHARFESPDSVRVGDDLLVAPKIFVNTGGRAAIPDFPGIETVPYLTNTTIVGLDYLPEHLIIVGGSYIGLEFAQMYRRFGAKVTVIEKGARLIGREDEDISEAVRDILQREGIMVRTGANCIRLSAHTDGVAVGVDCTEGEPDIIGSDVLLATGRRPNTDDLGLERAGVMLDKRGFIPVGDDLSTNIPGIWALGDCNGRGAFTHTAYNDFEIVAANLLDGANRKVSDRLTAYALYIDPPLGRVGMTETEARTSGRPLLVGTRPMTKVGRAREKGETQGFMKIIADAETQKILGAGILGSSGDEAIHGILDMMHAGIDYKTYQWAVPIHPTVSELIPTVLAEMKPVP